MQKKVVSLRLEVFLAVYVLDLGASFYLYSQGYTLVALIFAIILASFGPFIYSLLRREYEKMLLKEQDKYQSTLLEASKRLSRLKSEEEISEIVVKIIYAAMSLKSNAIYLKQGDAFRLMGKMGDDVRYIREFPLTHPVIKAVEKFGILIIDDKQKHVAPEAIEAEAFFSQHAGRLVVPITYDDKVIAIFIIGEKENETNFSEGDINVLNIIAVNTALTIENSRYHGEIKRAQAHIFQAEKMATIGTMADGLSHQINNRFHALGFISGDALETVRAKKTNDQISDEMKKFCEDIEKALTRVQDNVTQGGEIVRSLMKYTRQGQDGFSEVDLNKVVDSSYEMAQFKMKKCGLPLEKHYDPAQLPKIKGNATQLQEVFFNLIDNAYDSINQRRDELLEADYQPLLSISAQKRDRYLEFIFEDNGMGVKEEDKIKLFTPFFSTKISSQSGSGIGLYVVHKIVEENHGGKVVFDSEYKKGARVRLYLPVVSS